MKKFKYTVLILFTLIGNKIINKILSKKQIFKEKSNNNFFNDKYSMKSN